MTYLTNRQQTAIFRARLGASRLALATVAAAGAATAGLAQDGTNADDGAFGDEIVVTTERREQTLQEVPGVAKAATGEDLRRQGINQFTDLANAFPQLNIGNREGNVEVFIRGIGDDNNTELSEPRSAILLDNVYVSRPRGLGSFFFDLARVEVNIGPQGTLRGRNATGGSLNLVSQAPVLGEFSGYGDIGFGNFNQREFQGAVNVPVSDTLALRFAGYFLENDAKIENVGPLEVEESRATEDVAFRHSLLWQPTDNFKFTLVGDFLDSRGTGFGGLDFFPFFQDQFIEAGNSFEGVQEIEDLDDPFQTVTQGSQPVQEQQIWGVRGVAQYDFEKFSVEYLGAYRSTDFFFNRSASDAFFPNFEEFFGIDLGSQTLDTATSDFLTTFSRVQFDQDFDSVIQELRVFANEDQRFRWTVGAFFFRETGESFFNTSADRGFVFAGVEFAFPDFTRENFAFYADGTFDISENFRITGGVRYTNERLARGGFGTTQLFLLPTEGGDFCCAQHRHGSEGFRFAGRDRELFESDFDLTTGEGRAGLFLSGIAQEGVDDTLIGLINDAIADGSIDAREISGITPNDGSRRDDYIDWRVRLEYDLTPDNLLYASVSTGTNSGGFNDSVETPAGIISPEFDVESVRVVEIGSKNVFAIGGQRAIFNVAGFWYDYQDQQFTVLAPLVAVEGSDAAALTSLRQNVGDSRILGFDVDYTQTLPANLSFRTNVQFLDTEFTDASQALVDTRFNFPTGPADTIPFDPVGNELPKASRWSGSLSLSQFFETGIGKFDWISSVGFRSDYFLTIFNGDGTLPTINAETFPDLDEAGLAALTDTVFGSAGASRDEVNGYIRLDLGAGWEPRDNVRIELYAKNVTDRAYSQTSLNTPGTNLRFLNDPRTYGGRIRVSF
ncbi:MAG: TonB-dependent receptor [Parvularculaceae bacterium]